MGEKWFGLLSDRRAQTLNDTPRERPLTEADSIVNRANTSPNTTPTLPPRTRRTYIYTLITGLGSPLFSWTLTPLRALHPCLLLQQRGLAPTHQTRGQQLTDGRSTPGDGGATWRTPLYLGLSTPKDTRVLAQGQFSHYPTENNSAPTADTGRRVYGDYRCPTAARSFCCY